MRIAVCYNQAAARAVSGIQEDLISEAGAAEEAAAVETALKEIGHQATRIALRDDINAFISELQLYGPELVFNLCEGFLGHSRMEMHVAALYELLGVPYTGASSLELGLTQDKVLTKDILSRHGLPTPDYLLAPPGHSLISPEFPGPYIIKPSREDASLGIGVASIAEGPSALNDQVAFIHDHYRQPALIEKYIDGREFNVAVINNQGLIVLPIAEILFSAHLPYRIVSYAGKWHEDSAEFSGTVPYCPADLTPDIEETLTEVALNACHLLGCRDYTRIDVRWRDGQAYILELNANPDISPDAGLARAAASAGLTYPELIRAIVNSALNRKGGCHA